MSIKLGSTLLAGVATNTVSNANYLLDWKWSDHIINSMEWLRADTFSWQDGSVYAGAYSHIIADYNGGTAQTETVGSYTITYVLADDGHKITTDETNVANIYNESGVAWYYVLDTANTRFKLPRVNPNKKEVLKSIKVLTDGCAKVDVENSSSVITTTELATQRFASDNSQIGFAGKSITGAAFNTKANTNVFITNNDNWYADFDNINNTSIFCGEKYLYFYVGQYSQSATEQTAGLNTSMFNNKMDLDLSNIDNTNDAASTSLNTAGIRTVVETYINGTNWYRIWSDGWIQQGGVAAGNGTVNLLKQMSNTNYIVLITGTASGIQYANDINSKTISSFVIYSYNSRESSWLVEGY